jgi:hypothetical protein
MRFIRIIAIIAMLSVFAIAAPINSFASEGGGSSYPNGADSIMAGALPPPGFYFLDYLTYYSADKLMDNNGDELPVDFDLDVFVNSFRFVYISKVQLMGGTVGYHTIIPVVLDMDIKVGGADDSNSGLGDVTVGTNLSWHTKNWHYAVALDAVLPVGDYDKDEMANLGRNYYTIEPIVGFTYISDGGFEVSSKIMYDFNTENTDTDYQTGQEFHFDYFVGYHFNKSWIAGIDGYYYKQMTDDKLDGDTVEDNKGQVFSYGPAVQYQYKNMSLLAQYQMETAVKNRSEGDKFWLKFVYAF